jgi:hypothetical protein
MLATKQRIYQGTVFAIAGCGALVSVASYADILPKSWQPAFMVTTSRIAFTRSTKANQGKE